MNKETRLFNIAAGIGFGAFVAAQVGRNISTLDRKAGDLLTTYGESVVGESLMYTSATLSVLTVLTLILSVRAGGDIFIRNDARNRNQRPPKIPPQRQ